MKNQRKAGKSGWTAERRRQQAERIAKINKARKIELQSEKPQSGIKTQIAKINSRRLSRGAKHTKYIRYENRMELLLDEVFKERVVMAIGYSPLSWSIRKQELLGKLSHAFRPLKNSIVKKASEPH